VSSLFLAIGQKNEADNLKVMEEAPAATIAAVQDFLAAIP
jgi:hypothetical protein